MASQQLKVKARRRKRNELADADCRLLAQCVKCWKG
jgi:hypothetical protein